MHDVSTSFDATLQSGATEQCPEDYALSGFRRASASNDWCDEGQIGCLDEFRCCRMVSAFPTRNVFVWLLSETLIFFTFFAI